MLAAAARLRRREEFAAAVRGGRRVSRGALVVHVMTSPPNSMNPTRADGMTPSTRAGFVVSKAVGGAVVRNLVRRRLRHAVLRSLDQLPAGTNIVVRALPSAATRPYADLENDLRAALAAAMLPKEQSTRDRSARRSP